ncbi:MAG: hypothetical protein ACI8S6_002847 [Myxococcota bacterium]|jgi:hypothetical protein
MPSRDPGERGPCGPFDEVGIIGMACYIDGMTRRLLKKLIRRTTDRSESVNPLVRLASRIAGIVYPTNNSGNNMSVR